MARIVTVGMRSIFGMALILGGGAVCRADGELDVERRDADRREQEPSETPSSNYGKTAKFIPGEEVVTATGKRVKVWSTEGPVPVSRAPEPFQDGGYGNLPPNTHIVVDDELLRRQRGEDLRPGHEEPAAGSGGEPPHPLPRSDSFAAPQGER